MRLALLTAALLLPAIARADALVCPPGPQGSFAYNWSARTLVGVGGVPDLSTNNSILTTEFGRRLFGGALSTGFSFSAASNLTSNWVVITPGLLAKVDLTYVFLSGAWSQCPPTTFPFHVQLGSRIGLDVSDSFQLVPSYVLIRAALQSFVDLEIPLDSRRHYSLVLRGAVDTAVTLDALFRWSASVGLNYSWGLDDD